MQQVISGIHSLSVRLQPSMRLEVQRAIQEDGVPGIFNGESGGALLIKLDICLQAVIGRAEGKVLEEPISNPA